MQYLARHVIAQQFYVVGLQGIEPWLQAPHARVLPLYYNPKFK
jgi:hypothetical protein